MKSLADRVGQFVILARQRAAARWTSLSIPRGKSKEFEVGKDGAVYLPPKP